MQNSWKIHAAAAFGLEASVKRECEKLGFQGIHVEEGHVIFEGGPHEVALANIALRTADRVLLELGRFPAKTFEELYENIKKLAWKDYLPREAAFPIRARSVRSVLKSETDLQKIGKKAIVDAMNGRKNGAWLPENGALYPVLLTLRHDECIACLDTTGEGLFKRGYREEKGSAPIKETLAAALVDLSVWNPSRTLADVFCGSGTILIEAARKARGMDPGLDRSFLSMKWDIIGEKVYAQVRRDRMQRISFDTPLELLGFDIDPKVISIARANAEAAGVGEDIHFMKRDMREVFFKENFGVMITNPPYGKRIGEIRETRALMQAFSERFFKLRTWSIYVISAFEDWETLVGNVADRRRKLYNGGIKATYYEYLGPNPERFK
ncbi:MAG: class I SAM-dependent RNA methyltransferase [Peptoniphilaceae bacterium]|nr:class I SAM-dependent RNA methyltransferase [Peptoniphilaceae bacterium]